MQNRIHFFIVIFLCTGLQVAAQTFIASEAHQTRNHLGYEILGKYQESYLLFRDKGDEFDLMSFNGGMVNTWTREIDIPTKATKIIEVIGGENDFSVFYKTKIKGGDYVLGVRKFDPSALMIDSLTIKTYGNRYDLQPHFEAILSEDKRVVALINSAKDDRLDIICYQIDQMRLIWERSYFIDDEKLDRKNPNFILTNTGVLYLVTDENNRKSKIEDHRVRIVMINNQSDNLYTVPLDQYLTSDIVFRIDHDHQTLIGSGLYSDKNSERVHGTFFVKFDLNSHTSTKIYTPFDEQMAGVMFGKDGIDASKGITYLQARKLLLRKDGGSVLVCERNHYIERGISSPRSSFWRDAPRRVVDFYFDDIILITTQPDGKVNWRTILHKKQYSQDDEGIYSSFFLMLEREQLRILFNDEIQNENTCSAYIVTPIGTYSRESIFNTEDQNLKLRFRDAYQVNLKELIVPSEFNNKMQLVRVQF
jgi:hypothetical protein